MIELFRDLSAILCGEDDLPLSLAGEYFTILQPTPNFGQLLQAYKIIKDQNPPDPTEEVKKKLLPKKDFRPAIKTIITLWYLGKINNMSEMRGPKYYYHYESLIWKAVHAHPPGLTGAYFGYWAYKPET